MGEIKRLAHERLGVKAHGTGLHTAFDTPLETR
jgi:hypothetical protein